MRTDWGYVALCLVVPLLWGVVSARVFDWIQSRRRPEQNGVADRSQDDNREMYYI